MVAALVTLLLAVGAYLLGSIPTGLLVAQAQGIDLRAVGSGNIGATNTARALGRKMGLVVFVGDALKGFLPVLLARGIALPDASVVVVGFAAFAGHLFSIYLRFQGGKGVATAAGIFLAMGPAATALAALVWGLTYAWCRISSVASLMAALGIPLALIARGAPWPYTLCGLCVLGLVVWKHRENIERLRRGIEK